MMRKVMILDELILGKRAEREDNRGPEMKAWSSPICRHQRKQEKVARNLRRSVREGRGRIRERGAREPAQGVDGQLCQRLMRSQVI